MANGHNLFISYDLHDPGKNYTVVIEKIKSLGNWAKPNLSYWFVDSRLNAQQAANAVWTVMDANDKLVVVDTKTNEACWYNLDKSVVTHIQQFWNK